MYYTTLIQSHTGPYQSDDGSYGICYYTNVCIYEYPTCYSKSGVQTHFGDNLNRGMIRKCTYTSDTCLHTHSHMQAVRVYMTN
jgi:hypothetical protein